MTYGDELRRQFPTETAFQMALFSYVYNGKYKEELQTIKESLEWHNTERNQ